MPRIGLDLKAYETSQLTRAITAVVREVGFEPTTGFRPPVSKTGALPFCYSRVWRFFFPRRVRPYRHLAFRTGARSRTRSHSFGGCYVPQRRRCKFAGACVRRPAHEANRESVTDLVGPHSYPASDSNREHPVFEAGDSTSWSSRAWSQLALTGFRRKRPLACRRKESNLTSRRHLVYSQTALPGATPTG